MILVWLGLAMMAVTAPAQTTNTFPLNGSVGIGTTAPQALLDIQPSTDGVPSLLLSQQNCVGCGWSMSAQDDGAFRLFRSDNPSSILSMLYNNGNVGIGTTSPSYRLDVASPSIRFGNYTNDAENNITSSVSNVLLISRSSAGDSGTSIGAGYVNKAMITTQDSGQFGPDIGSMIMLRGIYTSIGNQGGTESLHAGDNVEFYFRRPGVTGGAPFTTPTTFYDDTTSLAPFNRFKPELGMILNSAGNVGIGTTAPGQKLEVSGNAMVDGALIVGNGGIYFPGNSTPQAQPYTGVTCGDYAESVDVAGDRKSYEPGDVLVIGAESGSDVLKSAEPYSTLVGGIYSTKPGTVGRRQTTDYKSSKTEVPMAMVGIVPTKVSAENGPIKRGDLMVTSSTPGYAMKGTDRSRMLGAVVGKALGSLNSGTGVIEVLVTLQ